MEEGANIVIHVAVLPPPNGMWPPDQATGQGCSGVWIWFLCNYQIGPQCMSKAFAVRARSAPTHVHHGPQWHSPLPLARGSVRKAWQKVARLELHKQAIEGMGWGHVAISEDCHGPCQKTAPAAQKV